MNSEAASAAVRVCDSLGYATEDPIVLQETNNTVMWLRPHAIIAKVGTWRHSMDTLAREHAVASALAANGAPIAPPLTGVEPIPDEETGFLVTLWARLDHDVTREVTPKEVGGSLLGLHEDLDGYQGDLPTFQVGLSLARTAMADDQRMAVLSKEDRSMLLTAFDRLRAQVETRGYVERPLHGEPHSGNVLSTPAGLRWVDLEGVCIGPAEWDLAFLPEEAASVFPAIDHELLDLLRTLNSALVATWCWLRSESDEMRRHGEHHLEEVRRANNWRALGG